MNRDLSVKQIISILLPFILLLSAYFWALDSSYDRTYPLILKRTDWGTLTLPTSDGQLYEFTHEGQLIRHVNLQYAGIKRLSGDLQFINQNEVLVYSRHSENTLWDNLSVFMRAPVEDVYSSKEGLMRCDIQRLECELFSDQLPIARSAVHFAYDAHHQHVYFANAGQHTLYRLDLEGNIIDSVPERIDGQRVLKFPNQVSIHRNQLWVMDTNHKELKSFSLGSASLQVEPEVVLTSLEEETCSNKKKASDLDGFSKKCFPSSFAAVDDRIWFTIAENDMNHADIFIYSKTNELIKRLNLEKALASFNFPYDHDATALNLVNDVVVFQDTNNLAVIRFDLINKQYSIVNVPGLEQVMRESLSHKTHYSDLADLIIYSFFGLLSLGLMYALYLQFIDSKIKSSEQNNRKPTSGYLVDNLPYEPFWFTDKKSIRYVMWSLPVFHVVFSIMLYSLRAIEGLEEGMEDIGLMWLLLTAVMIPVFIVLKFNVSKQLGITRTDLMIRDAEGNTVQAPIENVTVVGKRGILIDDVFKAFGNEQQRLISKEEYQNYLEPYLSYMNEMSEWQYMKHRLKTPVKETYWLVISVIPAVVLFAYMVITGRL